MRSELTDGERDTQLRARAFVERHLPLERVLAADREGRFPLDLWATLAQDGWPARFTPRPWGEGAPFGELVVALEGLAYGDITLVSALQRSACFGGHLAGTFGTPALQERLMPAIASGEALISFALTEREAGSDAAALQTRAVRVDGGYELQGEKLYVGGAEVAHTVFVAARVGDGAGKEGISLFAVPARAPGVTIADTPSLSHRGVGIATVTLEAVRVGDDDVVGGPGQGWQAMMSSVVRERLQVAAICIGAGERTLDLATEHAATRAQFGRPLIQLQAVAHHLADMWMRLEAARALVHATVAGVERGEEDAARPTLAKLVATEAFWEIADRGLQVAGGAGFLLDSWFQFALREARLYRIGGGTSEVLRTVVARDLAQRVQSRAR